MAARPAERRRARRRDQRPAEAAGLAARLRDGRGDDASQAPRSRAPTASPCSATATSDGVAETASVLIDDLTSPFGMALIGDDLYVADTDQLLAFPYQPGATRIDRAGPTGRRAAGRRDQPSLDQGPRRAAGTATSSTSRSDRTAITARTVIDAERGRAAIWRVDPADGSAEVFASGLRNPVGLDFEPRTGALWAVVNERDELGGDLVPDYLTEVRAGGFYGWPYSYFGDHLDPRVEPQRPDLVARALVPDYALGAHVAPLGLTFADGATLGPRFAEGAFIGEHGSWNRRPRSGYRVVFVPFRNGRPSGEPIDVLTGFLDGAGQARGRPVGVAIDGRGGLLVADDVGNAVWRVTAD